MQELASQKSVCTLICETDFCDASDVLAATEILEKIGRASVKHILREMASQPSVSYV